MICMKQVKWGIIGCGDVTEVKSGPAFNLIDNSQLVAVMRRNADKAKDYAYRHGVKRWYDNADDLIKDSEVNAINVATPPNVHAELAIKALKAGKPVYVEKPMALNFVECQQMIQASEQYKTPLYVAYYRRALPGFLKVKSLIDQGAIGRVKLVNIRLHKPFNSSDNKELPWRVNPEVAGGGHFFDLASHQLDFIDFLFGPIQKVHAEALNQTGAYKAEDIVSATFTLPENILLNGQWCFTVPKHLDTDIMEIIGEKGSIRFSCFEFKAVELITKTGTELFDNERPNHVQQPLIKNVVEALLNKQSYDSNAVAASRTSWVMDQVVKKYYSNI